MQKSSEKLEFLGAKDSTVSRELALYMENLGSDPGIRYGPESQDWFLSIESGITQVLPSMAPKQTKTKKISAMVKILNLWKLAPADQNLYPFSSITKIIYF